MTPHATRCYSLKSSPENSERDVKKSSQKDSDYKLKEDEVSDFSDSQSEEELEEKIHVCSSYNTRAKKKEDKFVNLPRATRKKPKIDYKPFFSESEDDSEQENITLTEEDETKEKNKNRSLRSKKAKVRITSIETLISDQKVRLEKTKCDIVKKNRCDRESSLEDFSLRFSSCDENDE